MKTTTEIQIEYSKVIAQSRKLDACADDLRTLYKELDDITSDLRAGWAGESADIYLSKCQELRDKLRSSQLSLSQTSSVVRRTAELYRAAELAAIAIVKD